MEGPPLGRFWAKVRALTARDSSESWDPSIRLFPIRAEKTAYIRRLFDPKTAELVPTMHVVSLTQLGLLSFFRLWATAAEFSESPS